MISYTSTVGKKFTHDAQLKQFKGNTTVCHLSNQQPITHQLISIQDKYRHSTIGGKFAYLPASSFHMTIMPLLTQLSLPGWNAKTSHHHTLQENDQYLHQILSQDDMFRKCGNLEMKVVGLYGDRDRLLIVEPCRKEDQLFLRQLHQHLSHITQIPIASDYGFHVTLAYRIVNLDPHEQNIMNSIDEQINNLIRGHIIKFKGNAQFTVFEDMGQFANYQGPHTRLQLIKSRGYI